MEMSSTHTSMEALWNCSLNGPKTGAKINLATNGAAGHPARIPLEHDHRSGGDLFGLGAALARCTLRRPCSSLPAVKSKGSHASNSCSKHHTVIEALKVDQERHHMLPSGTAYLTLQQSHEGDLKDLRARHTALPTEFLPNTGLPWSQFVPSQAAPCPVEHTRQRDGPLNVFFFGEQQDQCCAHLIRQPATSCTCCTEQ